MKVKNESVSQSCSSDPPPKIKLITLYGKTWTDILANPTELKEEETPAHVKGKQEGIVKSLGTLKRGSYVIKTNATLGKNGFFKKKY